MTIQKTPHTQTQQNTQPEQSDLEANQQGHESGSPSDEALYEKMEGAETGTNRAPREQQVRNARHKTEPENEAHEGRVSTRTPKKPAQGITSHSSEEESERQQKVVSQRPDAQSGVNRSK